MNYLFIQINSLKYGFLEQNFASAGYLLGYGSIIKPGHITVGLKLPISSHVEFLMAWEKELCRVYLMRMDTLSGSVERITFYNPENGYTALRLRPEHQNGIHAAPKTSLSLDSLAMGVGILPEHLFHIFDRFYRVDKSRSRQAGGGSGIGLTIARALIEAHSGRTWVESVGSGQGSTFNFTLPVAK